MKDAIAIIVGTVLVLGIVSAAIVGGVWLTREQYIRAGLVRCYVVGNAYPTWVAPQNCVQVSK